MENQQTSFSQQIIQKWQQLAQHKQFVWQKQHKNQNGYNLQYIPELEIKRESQIAQSESIFEDFDESKFNFSKIEDWELMFYLNLEHLEILEKELMDSIKTSEKFKEYCDNEVISNAVHKIIVNKYPLTDNHCLLLLFADEKLPQLISCDLIQLVFNLYLMSENDNQQMKIGFNSIGGYSSVNHLHFQLFFQSQLKIETIQSNTVFLIQTNDEYTQQIEIKVLNVDYLNAFVVSYQSLESVDKTYKYKWISYGAGLILDVLFAKNIPHNILFTDQKLFIIPRLFQNKQKDQFFRAGLHDLVGIITMDQQSYNDFDEQRYQQVLKQQVSVSDEQMSEIMQDIKQQL